MGRTAVYNHVIAAMNPQTQPLAALPVYEDIEVVWRHPRTVRIVSDSPAYQPQLTNSEVIATFTYDGDGKRVKAVENGVTTLFIGSHYEVTGSTVTKYYYAGATRIAVRKQTVPQNSTLTYLLGDHLGSTSLAVDASTGEVVETREWGISLKYCIIQGEV
jgi:hypothetical protein